MKKSILILILTAMLTACVPTQNTQESAEISTAQAVTEASESYEESEVEIETHPSTECEIPHTEATVTTVEIQSETVCTTTAVTDVQKEKSQYDPTESRQEKATDNPTDHTESDSDETLEESTEYNTEPSRSSPLENLRSNENPNCPPGSPGENTEVTVTEPEEYEEETEPPECCLSDYEKAAEIYDYMTANGSGTCVQYSWQTYEMCQNYGLECYFAWTENQLYGHVANVVKIDGAWYVLDTQAGCFLTENMCGFTEIVDANESYIANADIISSVRYE